MTFVVKEISNRNLWDHFLKKTQPHTFLHDWEWGEVHQALQGKIWRLGIFEGEELVSIALILKIQARRGSFLFCPHGPIVIQGLSFKIQDLLNELLKYLRVLSNEEKCSFIRMSPLFLDTVENRKMFRDLGFRDAPIHMHSELGWILHIEKEPQEIQKEMRKTTRHEIRKGKEAQVQVVRSSDPDDLRYFFEVYDSTVLRKHFVPFSRLSIEEEFRLFQKKDKIQLFLGKYENEILYAALILFSNGSAFYHHGASKIFPGKPSASHLVQWNAILEAKKRGCKFYNFWGVSPENKPYHPWAGASRFKKGFGGSLEAYVHAQDFVLNCKYMIPWTIESLRKAYRRL